MKKMTLPDCFLHGGDYNPDQWMDHPEILEEDILLMKQANVNSVTLGVFSWAKEEPEDGVYDLDWLEEIIDRLYENGISTILATPTAARPHWLAEKYEDTNMVTDQGIRRRPGFRSNFCPSSKTMRQKMHGIDEALAKRFGRKDAVIAWHLSNEYAGEPVNWGACYCNQCQDRFRSWLKDRYQTIEHLNQCWWTGFWSNHFDDFSQINAPTAIGENRLEGLKLDWKRFTSDNLLDFCKDEIAAIRKYSDKPCTTNYMGFFEPLDYFKWSKELDFVSDDSYPFWHIKNEDVTMAYSAAADYTLMRSMKKQPFVLMESVCSSVEWMPRNPLKRPGMHMLSSMQTIACGSNGVNYFQWRKSRGSCEKYHGAVVDHKNSGNTRVFRDVTEVGERLKHFAAMPETDFNLASTVNKPKIALIYDWENRWAVDLSTNLMNPFDYQHKWMPYFEGFWKLGVDVDIVNMDDDLTGYKVVVAPVNYMYRGSYMENVRRFVSDGGTYITTYYSGEADENNLCFTGQHPLSDLLGIRTEEIDVKPPFVSNGIVYLDKVSSGTAADPGVGESCSDAEVDAEATGKRYGIKDLCALVHAESADVLAVYTDDFYKGMPALTVNQYGAGKAYYIAAESEISFIKDLYRGILERLDCYEPILKELPEGVTVSKRVAETDVDCKTQAMKDNGEPKAVYFVQNYNPNAVEVETRRALRDMERGIVYDSKVILAPYDCKIVMHMN